MKINGPNHSNFNPYQKQINKQVDVQKGQQQQDQIEISKQAKEMQGSGKTDPARQKLVEQIKVDVDTGNYQVDAETTAKNMSDFWSKG